MGMSVARVLATASLAGTTIYLCVGTSVLSKACLSVLSKESAIVNMRAAAFFRFLTCRPLLMCQLPLNY